MHKKRAVFFFFFIKQVFQNLLLSSSFMNLTLFHFYTSSLALALSFGSLSLGGSFSAEYLHAPLCLCKASILSDALAACTDPTISSYYRAYVCTKCDSYCEIRFASAFPHCNRTVVEPIFLTFVEEQAWKPYFLPCA